MELTMKLGASSSPAATLSGKATLAVKKSVPGTAGTSPAGGQVSAGRSLALEALSATCPPALVLVRACMHACINGVAKHASKDIQVSLQGISPSCAWCC